jgi:hypothetical protein
LLNKRVVFKLVCGSGSRRPFSAAGGDDVDEEDQATQPVTDIDELRLSAALRCQPAKGVLVTPAWFTAAVVVDPEAPLTP